MMILNANKQAGFTTLRKLLKITAGNMDHHTKTLETAGFLKKFKTFSFRQPITVLKITNSGKKAFRTYADQLTEFLIEEKNSIDENIKKNQKNQRDKSRIYKIISNQKPRIISFSY